MPNLIVLTKRSLVTRIENNFLKLPEKPDCVIVSPGGCGSVSLIKYLEKYCKSNLYFEKKYDISVVAHLYKPPHSFFKENIKVIILKRSLNEIYVSMKSRGFLRNALVTYGDLIPYLYTNIFKDKNKLKKRFIDHLKFFYSNWSKYPKNLKLEINYKDLYSKKNIQKKIASFLEINNKDFLHKFPKHKKYIKNKNFVDPSTLLSKQIKLYQKKS
ncbi:hypothetical protein N9O39_02495 [Candidatus Pelagibacter sp.]|nr:hypothetical protein [Candidatus Pelagibacter sp.]